MKILLLLITKVLSLMFVPLASTFLTSPYS